MAGSCIGVILLVMLLELLRRGARNYDRWIVLQAAKQSRRIESTNRSPASDKEISTVSSTAVPRARTFRPNLAQQATRALMHMLQFAVAYFVMLLAMYYNGYIIICIIIGAFLGSFLFSWETMAME